MTFNLSSMPAIEQSEDSILTFTHMARMQAVAKLTETGIPTEDPKKMGAFLTTLADMDRAALGRKRLKTEEKLGNAQALAAGAIAEVLRKTNNGRIWEALEPVDRKAPTLGGDIPEPELVPGEIDTGTRRDVTYDSFMGVE